MTRAKPTARRMRCQYTHWERCPNRATHWEPGIRAHYCRYHIGPWGNPIRKKK